MNQKSDYYKFVDSAKGLGILFIVLGHAVPNSAIRQFLYSFHVPLFFIISGFTFKLKTDKRRFYSGKLTRLLIPYYIFSIISIIIFYIMSKFISLSGDSRMIPNFVGMLYANSNTGHMTWNRPLWFLPCLFCSFIILDTLETLINKFNMENSTRLRLVIIPILWLSGIFLNSSIKGLYLPYHLESAVFLTGFSEFGVLLAKWKRDIFLIKKQDCKNKNMRCIGFLVLFLAGLVLSQINGHTDIRDHQFGNYPVLLVLTSIIFGSVTIFLASFLENNAFLIYCGTSSLSILLMHKFPILFFQEIAPYIRDILAVDNTLLSTICGMIVSGLVIIMCLAVERIILIICPVMVGRSMPFKGEKTS